MPAHTSVSDWLANLKQGDLAAAERLWREYADRLAGAARRRLEQSPPVPADEEDVAQSVLRNICQGAVNGRLQEVRNRDELWWLLLKATKQKVIDYVRRENALKRGGGRVLIEADIAARQANNHPFSLDQLVAQQPTAEFIAALEEETAQLMQLLRDDQLRRIAAWRIEGLPAEEIAGLLSVSVRSVERKLRLIRQCWGDQLTSRRSQRSGG